MEFVFNSLQVFQGCSRGRVSLVVLNSAGGNVIAKGLGCYFGDVYASTGRSDSTSGLMDEAFFVYAEEVDWCFRFSQAGWRRVFTPEARIIHLDGGGKSTSQVNIKMFVQLQKSTLIFLRKNSGVIPWLLAKLVYVVSDSVRAVAWFMLSIIHRDRFLRQRSVAAVAALQFLLLGVEPA